MSSEQPQEPQAAQTHHEETTNVTMADITDKAPAEETTNVTMADITEKAPADIAQPPSEAQNHTEQASLEPSLAENSQQQPEIRAHEQTHEVHSPMAVDSNPAADQPLASESIATVAEAEPQSSESNAAGAVEADVDSAPLEHIPDQEASVHQASNGETTHDTISIPPTETETGVAAPVEEVQPSSGQTSQPTHQHDQPAPSEAPTGDAPITHDEAAHVTVEQPAALDVDADDAKEDFESYQANKRPESLVTSPLTHPNGVEMFPSLSTEEQVDLAREALDQAQDSIVAESSAWSATDDVSDGGYDSDGFSAASTSAESSVRDYLYENGRRYHAFRDGHYNFPNDDVEQEREDMKHAMMKLLCSRRLHFAPIGDNPQQILDIGTGTGIWSIEMGDQFPSAQVLGVDLSPIQPDWLPPNVKFLVDDVESPWLHPRNHFDYIHSRHTVMAIKDWMKLFRRALEHLKPGGWIELQEIHHCPKSATGDGTVPPEHPVARFWDLVTEGLNKMGVDLNMAADGKLCKMMEDAGFVNVTEIVLHVPIGIWPKNKVLKAVGVYWRTILLDGLQAIALGPLTRGLQWNRDEVEVFLTSVRRAYHDNAALMYMPLHIIYAQKPEDMT